MTSKIKVKDLHRAARLATALANIDVLQRKLAQKRAADAVEMVLEIGAGELENQGGDEYAKAAEAIVVDARTGLMILSRVADVLCIELGNMGINLE